MIPLSATETTPKSMLAHRNRPASRARIVSTLACLLLPLGAVSQAFPQSPEEAYEHAFWLEHEGEQPEAALEAYLRVSQMGTGEWAARAERRAAGLGERLASADLAALMPEDTIVYAELNQPGERIETVLGQLGLTGQGIDLGDRRLAISPILVHELLGLRAAAIGLTSLDGSSPPGGVAVLDPGDLDVLRGLLDTALPAGGRATEPIGGFETWLVEDMLWVTATHNLIVAGTAPALVEGVLSRLKGSGDGNFLENEDLASSLALRDGSLVFGCVHLEPVMPQLRMLLAMAAREEPEFGAALELLDVESTRALAGRIQVNSSGLGIDLALELDEEHRNLAFDMVRLPILGRDGLKSIPAGSAAFASLALNPLGELPSDGTGRVGAMDIGRELFGNLVQASAYVLPAQAGSGMVPDAGLALRVNDLERSTRLWTTLLGVAALAEGGAAPLAVEVGGHEATRYTFADLPLFVLPHAGELLLATSVRGLEAAVEAEHSGRSLLDDDGFQNVVDSMADGGNALIGLHLGRVAGFVLPNLEGQEREEAAAALDLMGGTTLSVGLRQDVASLTFSAALAGIPDVSGLLGAWIRQEANMDGNADQVAWR